MPGLRPVAMRTVASVERLVTGGWMPPLQYEPRIGRPKRTTFGLQSCLALRESNSMVLPQFSLRMALGLTALLGFVSLLISRGLQGNAWAMGISVALIALLIAFLAHAAVFGIVYLVSRLFWNRSRSPVLSAAAVASISSAPREHADLVPPASELT